MGGGFPSGPENVERRERYQFRSRMEMPLTLQKIGLPPPTPCPKKLLSPKMPRQTVGFVTENFEKTEFFKMSTNRKAKAARGRIEEKPTLRGPGSSDSVKDHLWIERHPAITVVHLGVEFHSSELQLLIAVRRRLLQLAAEIDPPCLLLDFGSTEYFGAEFIGVMFDCYARIKNRDGCFALCCLQPLLSDELKCTRLDQLLSIYDGHNEALAAIVPTVGALNTPGISSRIVNYE